MKKLYKKYFGEFLVLLAAGSYSFEWYFIRELIGKGYSPLDVTLGKILFAFMSLVIILLIFFRKEVKQKISFTDLFFIGILALIAISGNTFFNYAITETSVANVLTISYSCVFWGLLFGIIFLGEKVGLRKILFTILAFVGIVLVVVDIQNFIFEFGRGEMFALFVSLCMGISPIFSKKLIHIPAFYRACLIFFITTVFVILYLWVYFGMNYFEKFFHYEFLLYGGLLGFTAGALGRGLKELSFKYVSVSVVLVIMLFEPILQIFTAYIIGEEVVSFVNIIGMMLVFFAVVKVSKKKNIEIESEREI